MYVETLLSTFYHLFINHHYPAACGCKGEYSIGVGCNAETGQCECLPGVVGEKCDQCPHRWVFVPEIGCHQCDNCHHALLDDTDALAAMIDPIIIEFDVSALRPSVRYSIMYLFPLLVDPIRIFHSQKTGQHERAAGKAETQIRRSRSQTDKSYGANSRVSFEII